VTSISSPLLAARTPALDRRARWLACAAVLLPLPILIWFIWQHAILVPYGDEFSLVPLIHNMNTGTLTFANVVAQHNEHRPVFPNLLLLVMADVSHWTISWEIVANLVLAFASFALLLKLVWQTFPERPVPRWGLALAFAWIAFSPNQYENWLSGWEIEWFLCILGVLVTITVLSSSRPMSMSRMGIAAVAAAVADYSLASGVLAWVAGLIILFCRREKPAWKFAWTLIAVLIASPYYYHYRGTNPRQGSATYTLEHPGAFGRYVLTYLGDPLSTSHRSTVTQIGAAFAGVALAAAFTASCCYVALRNRAALPRLAPWIALAAFSVGSAVLTGVGRLKLGSVQALSSRYVSVSLLFLMAAIVVAIIALENLPPRHARLFQRAATASALSIGALVIVGYPIGILLGRRYPDTANYPHCVYTARSAASSCLRVAYPPSPAYAFRQIQYLRTIHWAGF
jgi:hypothetical protein